MGFVLLEDGSDINDVGFGSFRWSLCFSVLCKVWPWSAFDNVSVNFWHTCSRFVHIGNNLEINYIFFIDSIDI